MAGGRKIVRETAFYLGVAVVVVVALFPFYWVLRTSLESDAQVSAGVGGANGIVPSHLSGSAFVSVFTQQNFLRPLINSVIVALGATLVTVGAAQVDGATRLTALRRVVVPVAVPAVFTAGILCFILAWNDFTFAVSFLYTFPHFTAPLAIVTFGQTPRVPGSIFQDHGIRLEFAG